MGVFGPRIFVFDELFSADQTLRGQARAVRGAASGLTVPAGGLPPEAQSVLSGLGALRGRLERAADALVEAASTLGQIGVAAQRADSPGLLDPFMASLRGNLLPPGEHGPLGPYPWVFGRLTFLNSAATKMLLHRYGYAWVKDGNHWRVNGSGPRLHPRLRTWVDRASKAGKVAGPAATAAISLNNRLRDGASLPKATAGAVGESATVLSCAAAGVKVGGGVPVPHPAAKGALAIGGGVVGGAACSGPGKWVGDKVSDGAGAVAGFVKKVLP